MWDGERLYLVSILCAGSVLLLILSSLMCLNFLGACAVRRDFALRREIGGCDAQSLAQVILRRTPSEILDAIALLRRTNSG